MQLTFSCFFQQGNIQAIGRFVQRGVTKEFMINFLWSNFIEKTILDRTFNFWQGFLHNDVNAH